MTGSSANNAARCCAAEGTDAGAFFTCGQAAAGATGQEKRRDQSYCEARSRN
jgi:hypothetical protein